MYTKLVKDAGKGNLHRYYKIEEGTHIDSYYDPYPEKLRPILPCHLAAFEKLEEWVERGDRPPRSKLVPKLETSDVVNSCSISKEATYSGPMED